MEDDEPNTFNHLCSLMEVWFELEELLKCGLSIFLVSLYYQDGIFDENVKSYWMYLSNLFYFVSDHKHVKGHFEQEKTTFKQVKGHF